MANEPAHDPAQTAPRATTLSFVSSGPTSGPTPWFVSDRTAPRRRRQSDILRLVAGAAAFGLLAWSASDGSDLDIRVFTSIGQLPGWIRSLAWFSYSAAGIAAFAIAVGTIFAGVGRGIGRDLTGAIALASTFGAITARLASGDWPQLLPEFFSLSGLPRFPTLRVAWVVAVALILGPYVNLGVRRVLRRASWAVLISPILLGVTTITSLFGALMLGLASVAAVRLLFGTPEGLPSVGRLEAALASVGIHVEHLAYRTDQPGTVGLATAVRRDDGTPLGIKIYGEDAEASQRTERIWRSLWYRRAGPSPRAGRTEQAQHEALALLTAHRAGVRVPDMIGAGMTPDGDVLLVTGGHGGEPVGTTPPTDATLRSMWREVRTLHLVGRISHGSVVPESFLVDGDRVELTDFDHASMFPTEQQLATDVVSLLALQASLVGADRAVAAALDVVEADDLALCMPYLQDAVLEPSVRAALKRADASVKQLRERLAEELEIEPPELAPVRRIKVGSVLIAVAAIIAANSLISQIADVGIDVIADELAAASIGWLVVTFLIRLASYTTAYVSMRALIDQDLPLLPTTLLQSAKSFVGLVVPSMVGRVGMDIRFLQKLGVPLAMATTQGPVISLVGFVAEVLLLLVTGWAIGQAVETDELFDFDAGGLIAIAVLVVVIGAVVVLALPKLRNKLVPIVKDAIGSIRTVVTSPKKLGAIFSGELMDRLAGGLALGATVTAFGADLSFAALVFVSVGTGLLAGLAPVPGGIGVAEATMTGLLSAVGLPPQQAVAIAIVYRMVTSYLPPVLGFFSFRWLTRTGYL